MLLATITGPLWSGAGFLTHAAPCRLPHPRLARVRPIEQPASSPRTEVGFLESPHVCMWYALTIIGLCNYCSLAFQWKYGKKLGRALIFNHPIGESRLKITGVKNLNF